MEETRYHIPHTLYNAAIALLQETHPAHSQLDLYKLGLNTAEFQVIQAAWDFFELNDGATKEKLEKCQAALGFKNVLAFRKSLIRSQFLTGIQFDKIFQKTN